MSNIEQNLQKILTSRYGKDVRQSIHDSIHDCYEDGKAGAVDLVARERIDNLVANNNPTEGNSELIDIRVGADGTTYDSAGEAVRGQFTDMKDKLYDTVYSTHIEYTDFTNGGYLASNGTFKELSGYYTTDYIPVTPGISNFRKISGRIGLTAATDLPTACLYDEMKSFLRSFRFDTSDDLKIITKDYDFTGASYIRVTTRQSVLLESSLEIFSSIDELVGSITNMEADITNMEADITNMEADITNMEAALDSFDNDYHEIGKNYTKYSFSGATVSDRWYGIGSKVKIPQEASHCSLIFKSTKNGDALAELVVNNVIVDSKEFTMEANELKEVIFECSAYKNEDVVVRISSEISGCLYPVSKNNIEISEYGYPNVSYAKNNTGWGTYEDIMFTVPVIFYKVYKTVHTDKKDIECHDVPTIYTVQFSDDYQKSPPFAIFVDSVIKSKQDVSFNGLDRKYLTIPNDVIMTDDISQKNESVVLSGDGYNDKTLKFTNVSVSTKNLVDKSAVVLQIGDSVTFGAGSQYNTDNKPNISWAYLAYLGKKYFKKYEQVGNNVYENIIINEETQYMAKAEGHGGWSLYNYLYDGNVYAENNTVPNPFYDANKIWADEELNSASVKFSINKYMENAGIEMPTHIIIQLGFNDPTDSDFCNNMRYIISAIKEEFPNMIIGISLLRDYGIFYEKYYPNLVPNMSSYHGALYEKMSGRLENIIELEDPQNNVYFIPTYFISPTGESIPTFEIDDKNVAFRVDSTYHPNHKAHVEWGKEMFAWIAYTLLK